MKCRKLGLNMIFHQYNDYHNKQKSVNSSFEVLRFGSTFSLVYSLGSRQQQVKKIRKKKLILTALFSCWLVFPAEILILIEWALCLLRIPCSLFCFCTGSFLKKSRFLRRLTVMSITTKSKIGHLSSTS